MAETNNLPPAPVRQELLTGGVVASAWQTWFGQLYSKIGGIGANDFTPAFTTSGVAGTPAYSSQVGRCAKIGNVVVCDFAIALSSWSGSPTGNVFLSGIPFAFVNDTGSAIIGKFSGIDLGASHTQLGIIGSSGNKYATLWGSGSGLAVSASQLTASSLSSTAAITGTIVFTV